MPAPQTTQLGFVTWDRMDPTGGNTYDQNLIAELRALGVDVRLHALAGPWPEGDASSHARLARALREAPTSLVDGIVACAAPDVIAAAVDSGQVITVVIHMPIGDEGGLEPAIRERYAALEGKAVHAASGILCSSHWSAAQLRGRYGRSDVGVAIPGVSPAVVARGSQDGRIRRILTVASLTPTKDQLTLVRALAQVADLPWTAALIGSDQVDPAYAGRLRAEVTAAGLEERIAVPGMLAGQTLDQEWEAADLLVLPSRTETYGLVVGEALARGIPAVVPAGTGAVEALQQGAATGDATPGTAVPAGDPAGLAAVLRRWLTEPTLQRDWRQVALSRRDTLPGWRQTAEAVLAYLKRPHNPPSTRAGSPPALPPTRRPGPPPSARSSPS
jgi:glycosyltransferase involved in cell wall biosynthesis